MKKWFAVMLLLSLALFGTVIGFNMFKQKMIGEYLANMPEPEFPVTLSDVSASDWTPSISVIGFIEPKQGVMLTNQSSGVIDKIQFESGETVKKGTVLLSLDATVEKANLASAQARLPAARARYKRHQDLYKTKSVSREALDEAEANYRSLQAQITSLKASIDRLTITTPFAGVVGLRNVFLGQYLKSGDNIVRLEDISTMRLRFTIPQRDISKIKIGQPIDILVDSFPDKQFKGKITAIEPAVNFQSGLIQVQADIPNNDGQLRAGMFARANVILPTLENQIVVPQTAITYTLYGDTVYIAKKDEKGDLRAYQQVIKTSDRIKDKVHVLEGINQGDVIVTSGQIRLSNQSKIKKIENNILSTPATTPKL